MFGPQERSWVLDIIRSIFSFIDKLVYQAIELVLHGIFDLASLKKSSELINDISVKIYVLIGIIMAFKLSFSFFQYIVNPENMADKGEKGVSNLFVRLMFMLILLVTLPSVLFGGKGNKGLLSEAQEIILPMIPNMIVGSGEERVPTDQTISDAAKQITVTTLGAFYFQPKQLKDACPAPAITNLDDFTNTINARCGFLGKHYQYTYIIIVNFIVGVLLLLMFLDISIDVAKRVFKLLILEILAPIPIISYIDPKSSKGGIFSKWVSSLVSTFTSLFIRIGIVYLVLFFIKALFTTGFFENYPTFADNPVRTAYLSVMLILGLIYFAKEAPKFITDSLGLKDAGGGKFGFGTIAALGGSIGSAAISAKAAKTLDETKGKDTSKLGNRAKYAMAGLFGGAGGLAAGIYAASNKNSFGDVNKAIRERNARIMSAASSGSTFGGRLGSGMQQMFLGETTAASLKREIESKQAKAKLLDSILSRADDKTKLSFDTYGKFNDKTGRYNFGNTKFNYRRNQAAFEDAATRGLSTFNMIDENNVVHTMETEIYRVNSPEFLEANAFNYLELGTDKVINQNIDFAIEDKILDASNSKDYNVIKSKSGAIKGEVSTLERKAAAAKANDRNAK